MPRKLKTFTTSAGFFDLAVAVPSMKAALEAWGSHRNLFHDGFARQSDDPAIVEATMVKPGVVLRRPIGTNAAYTETADLPRHLADGPATPPAAKRLREKAPPRPIDAKEARQAAIEFEREQERRRRQEAKEEAARERERERREHAFTAAEAALEEAEKSHRAAVDEIEKARRALDKKLQAEEARWAKSRKDLEEGLRSARLPRT
jgi:hypothetical protein